MHAVHGFPVAMGPAGLRGDVCAGRRHGRRPHAPGARPRSGPDRRATGGRRHKARLDGKTITTPGQLSKAISGTAGRPMTVEVERQRHQVTTVVTPHLAKGSSVSCPGGLTACIGVELEGGPNVRSSPFVAIGRAVVDLGRPISSSVAALGSVFSIHGISSYLHDLSSSKAASQAARSGNRIEWMVGAQRELPPKVLRQGPGSCWRCSSRSTSSSAC